MFQLADPQDRHEGDTGIGANILKKIVRPGGGEMLVCICSILARTDLVKRAGSFDRDLRFGMDSDFLFRLAMITDFCYVNRRLVFVDRSPGEQRHVGVSSQWNKLEFVLRQTQIRFEKFQQQSQGLPKEIQRSIASGLSSVHSGLANCHLEKGDFAKARISAYNAVQLNFSLNLAIKLILTTVSPQLALRAVQQHQQSGKTSARFI